MTANTFHASLVGGGGKILFGLFAVTAVAWIYLLAGAGVEMEQMDMGGGNIMLMPPTWGFGYAALVFAMWVVMMVAMMLPSAVPAILQAVSFDHGRRAEGMGGIPAVLFFTAGYLMVWAGFSVAATFLQWALDTRDLLSETMAIRSAAVAAMLTIAAGLYQLTPLKQACLRHCRTSAWCLTQDLRHGAWAISRQGMRYGVSCLGCCAVSIGLLFVAGVMNVLWMALIALGLLAERILPWGNRVAYVTGVGLVAWGSLSLWVAG
jgi:predicted metal-binding membrane protein